MFEWRSREFRPARDARTPPVTGRPPGRPPPGSAPPRPGLRGAPRQASAMRRRASARAEVRLAVRELPCRAVSLGAPICALRVTSSGARRSRIAARPAPLARGDPPGCTPCACVSGAAFPALLARGGRVSGATRPAERTDRRRTCCYSRAERLGAPRVRPSRPASGPSDASFGCTRPASEGSGRTRRNPGPSQPTNDRPAPEVLDQVVHVLAADRDADDPAVLRPRVHEREHVAQADADVAQRAGGR